jgi:AmmeMemoRadiSam system protein A
MLWRYEPPDLTEARREELLALVRTTIEEYIETGRIPNYETDDPVLARRSGVFVTLKEGGDPSTGLRASLRGCIGHTRADQPLYQVVQQMAVAAATEDPRFSPLTQEELADVTIEISVLSPFRRVTDVEQIQVGTHGLMIFQDGPGRQAGIVAAAGAGGAGLGADAVSRQPVPQGRAGTRLLDWQADALYLYGGGVRRVKKPPLQAGAVSSLCQRGQTYFSGTCARAYGSRTSIPGNIR